MHSLKIGFLVDSGELPNSTVHLIEQIKKVDCFSELILFEKPPFRKKQSKLKTFFQYLSKGNFRAIFEIAFIKLIYKIELKRVRSLPQHQSFLTTAIIDEAIKKVSLIPSYSKTGFVCRFEQSEIDKISNEQVDVLVRCGTGILKGRILDVAKYGVISAHLGDNRVNRGGPAGFWEVIEDQASSGFVIQQLTDELDGGRVIMRGNIMTSSYWLLNQANLLQKSNYFLYRELKKLAENNKLEFEEEKILYSKKLYKSISMRFLLQYISEIYVAFAFRKFLALIRAKRVGRWGVAFVQGDAFCSSLFRGNKIENPENRFLADPFLISFENKHFCFVEDYFYDEEKGKISVLQLDGNKYKHLGVVLEEDFHLSFPFIFEDEDNIYMIPESSQNQDIRLYKCLEFPLKWEFQEILMSGFPACDTMVLKKDNLWYLLTNFCSVGSADSNSELHMYYSSSLLGGDWQPCANNPVIFDSRKARNGGLFMSSGKLYRVNQVQGKAHYGKAFDVNEVVEINEHSYKERPVCNVEADFFDNIDSTHHFHQNENYSVWDFRKIEKLN